MNRGILFALVVPLIGSGLVTACRHTIDPHRIATIDSLITTMEAASFTLNELDGTPYTKADSILNTKRALFLQRFSDTLDRRTAAALGAQFVRLRDAARMAADHEQVRLAVERAMVRLQGLRTDLVTGAMDNEQSLSALTMEQGATNALDSSVQQVLANYRSMQGVLEEQTLVDSLLAGTGPTQHIP
jgi:hypothetical protein